MNGSLKKAAEGGEGGTGRRAARGERGAGWLPPTTAIQAAGYPAGAGE